MSIAGVYRRLSFAGFISVLLTLSNPAHPTTLSVQGQRVRASVVPFPAISEGISLSTFSQLPDRARKESVYMTLEGDLVPELTKALREVLAPRFEFRSSDTAIRLRLFSRHSLSGGASPPTVYRTPYTRTPRTTGYTQPSWKHTISITGWFNERKFRVTHSQSSPEKTVSPLLFHEAALKVKEQIALLHRLRSRIILSEGNRAIVDMGESVGLRQGSRLRVYDEDGKKAGILKVTSVRSEEAETRILRGADDIKEGFVAVEECRFRRIYGLQYHMFPMDIRSNPTYLTTTGTAPADISGHGRTVLVTASILRALGEEMGGSYAGVVFGTGYMDMHVIKGWEIIDFTVMGITELVPELLSAEFGAGLGFGAYGGQSWARPPGDYDDDIESDSGSTKGTRAGNWHAYSRLHYFFRGSTSLFVDAAYYKYSVTTEYQDSRRKAGSKGVYKIHDEWLEYDLDDIGGFTVRLGVSFWKPAF